jgi:ferric-dicitrate binding protein FerR (iron transport regulator)
MEYTHYIVEDFVLDESFKNWVLKKDQKDEVFWEQWVQEHPEMRSKVEEARDIILSMQVVQAKVSEEEIEDQFREVERFFDKQMKPDRKVDSLKRVTRIAATALILLSLGAGAWYYVQQTESGSDGITRENEKIVSVKEENKQEEASKQKKKAPESSESGARVPQKNEAGENLAEQSHLQDRANEQVKHANELPGEEKVTRHITRDDEKRRVILPDGTKVYMNEKSTLAYKGSWKEKETRRVQLSGEAYFQVEEKVHQGQKIGFVVSTRDLKVEVVGTEFNVQSRIEQTRVFLNSGKVQLRINGQSEAIAMKPGEMVEYSAYSGAIKSKPDKLRFISWLEAFGKTVRSTPRSGRMTMQTQPEGNSNNQGEIWQSGEDNNAYIDQVGENLKSKQLQQGESNEASAVVSGQSRRDQSDEAGWSTWQLQQGEGNVSIFNIVQSYNSNLYSAQAGRRNVARGRSKGEDNAGLILQSGEYNEAQLLQRGKDNEALILQKGPGGSGEGSGFMQELMEGRYNKVNVIQKGYNNRARTVQQGRNNRVKVNQNGN